MRPYCGLTHRSLTSGARYLRSDEYSKFLNDRGAIYQNFSRWDILGRYVWPNKFVANSHNEEIDFMKDWVNSRLQWLDEAILNLE